MARKKITEFRAKSLLIPNYQGIRITPDSDISKEVAKLQDTQTYVVKIDHGVKKRMKQGLILLDIKRDAVPDAIETLKAKGYTNFLIEPFLRYNPTEERYLSLQRVRDGIMILYAPQGGIEIEDRPESLIAETIHAPQELAAFAEKTGLTPSLLQTIYEEFEENYYAFFEINPLVLHDGKFLPLDIACEVDDAAELLVHHRWSADDFPIMTAKTEEEENIDILKTKSAASFSFVPLNLNGSIFMLLSGGGVSIVLADEVYNLGYGKELANYGEYSGNPNAEETYLYTKNVLQLLLKSTATKKVLLIGGGVANFTDIAKTFTGVIHALSEVADQMQQQHVTVFVRRGGPNQAEGLAKMHNFLQENNLLGAVCGPDTPLPDIVAQMVKTI